MPQHRLKRRFIPKVIIDVICAARVVLSSTKGRRRKLTRRYRQPPTAPRRLGRKVLRVSATRPAPFQPLTALSCQYPAPAAQRAFRVLIEALLPVAGCRERAVCRSYIAGRDAYRDSSHATSRLRLRLCCAPTRQHSPSGTPSDLPSPHAAATVPQQRVGHHHFTAGTRASHEPAHLCRTARPCHRVGKPDPAQVLVSRAHSSITQPRKRPSETSGRLRLAARAHRHQRFRDL